MDSANLLLLLKPLGSAALTLWASYAYGRALLRFAPNVLTELRPGELQLFSLGLGFAALSQIVYLLGICGFYYDVSFVVVALLAALAWFRFGRFAVAGRPAAVDPGERPWRLAVCVLGIPILPYWIANALAPEIGSDALGYHLGLVARYYREHALIAATNSVYGFLSQGAEMAYLFAYSFGRADAPKIVHFGLFLATLGGLVAFSRRYLTGAAGWIAVGLYAFASIVPKDAAMAYNDCALAFFGLLTFYALMLWREKSDAQTLCVTAALAGFCFSIKYTAAPMLAACGLAVTWLAWRREGDLRGVWRSVGLFAAVAALFVLPWVGRNVVIAGNPLAPFFNDLFPNPYATIDWERSYRDFMRDYRSPDTRNGWSDVTAKIWDVTGDGRRTGGIIGPVFLIAPLAVPLALRAPYAVPLLLAAGVSLLPWLSNAGTRFLIPGLVFVALLMAQAVLRLGAAGRVLGVGLLVVHAAFNFPPLMPYWAQEPVTFLRLDEVPWREALRIVPEREYRNRRVDRFPLAEALKLHAPPGSGALYLGADFPEEPFDGYIVFAQIGAIGEDLGRDLLMAVEKDFRPEKVLRVGWTQELEIQGFRLHQTASADQSWWEVAEVRPLLRGEPFDLPSDWKVEVSQYPFRGGRLIDSDPLSMWRSWQPLRPGLIEITGETPIVADHLEVVMAWGQHWTEYDFELNRVGYGWQPFSPGRDFIPVEISRADLARRLRNAYAEAGVSFVAANLDLGPRAFVARAIDEDPAAFSLEPVWAGRSERLYRVVE